MNSILQPELRLLARTFLVALTATLATSILAANLNSIIAQEQFLPLSEVKQQQPRDPFTPRKDDLIRGSKIDLMTSKKLPQWRNATEFARVSLPQDLEDLPREQWLREAPLMQSESGFGVRRMLHQLQIKVKDGRFVYFTNKDEEDFWSDVFFEYKGYDKQKRFYFVTYRLYNDAGFVLISAETGLIWFLDNVTWSPDRSRIASIGDSLNIAPFIVLRLSNGHATTEIFESVKTPAGRAILGRGADQISWLDERTIELSSQPDSPNQTDSRITLRLIDKKWKVTLVEPEVPRSFFVYPER